MQVEKQIIALYKQGMSQLEISKDLHVGTKRIGRAISVFNKTNEIPKPMKRGRPQEISDDIRKYIEIKTLQNASLTSVALSRNVQDNFHIPISQQYVSQIRNELKFHYRPPKKEQFLTEEQIIARKIFCQKMLTQTQYLDKIAFSDESRFVLGKDSHWVWVRKGEYTQNSLSKK